MAPADQGKASYSLKIRIGVWAKEMLGIGGLSSLLSSMDGLIL